MRKTRLFLRKTRPHDPVLRTSVDQNIVVQSDCMVVQCCQWLFRFAIFELELSEVTTLPLF